MITSGTTVYKGMEPVPALDDKGKPARKGGKPLFVSGALRPFGKVSEHKTRKEAMTAALKATQAKVTTKPAEVTTAGGDK